MFPIYEEQRNKIHEHVAKTTKEINERAHREINNGVASSLGKLERISTITEDYIRRGYHFIDSYDYSVGQYRTSSSYVRILAKQMRRRFICVDKRRAYSFDAGSYIFCATFTFPKTQRLAPLYSMFLLAAQEGERLTKNTIYRPKHVSSLYQFTVCGTDEKHSDLTEFWIEKAASDPEWRRLLKV
jgi:hypothetical protein